MEEQARTAAQGTGEAFQSIGQTVQQEMERTPNITSRSVRQVSEELKAAMRRLQATITMTVQMVSSFAYSLIIQVSKVMAPVAEKINKLAIQSAQKMAKIAEDAGKVATEMIGKAEAALTNMDNRLAAATRSVGLKVLAIAKTSTDVLLGLPELVRKDVTEKIAEHFTDMWEGILAATEGAVNILTTDLSGLMRNLETAAAIQQRIVDMRATATGALAAAVAGETGVRHEAVQMTSGDLAREQFQATHWPKWYDKYEGIFTEKMGQLHQDLIDVKGAIRGSRGATRSTQH
jgi:hypothetical protein